MPRPHVWTDDRIRALGAAYEAGGYQACYEAFPGVPHNTIWRRLFASGKAHSWTSIKARDKIREMRKTFCRGGNFDSTGLAEIFAGDN